MCAYQLCLCNCAWIMSRTIIVLNERISEKSASKDQNISEVLVDNIIMFLSTPELCELCTESVCEIWTSTCVFKSAKKSQAHPTVKAR